VSFLGLTKTLFDKYPKIRNTMKKYFVIVIAFFSILSCNRFDPEEAPLTTQINDFIWKGMNLYYLWQPEIPNLNDSKFKTEKELFAYLDDFDHPEDFFESLKYQPDVTDKWSWIVDDYVALDAYFSGVRKSSGAKIKLHLTSEHSENIFGIVRYIVPDTDAAGKPLQRGDVFNSVNGTLLTTSNYKDLIYNSDSYTLNLGTYYFNESTSTVEITSTGEDVNLVKEEYSENPVLINTVFEIDTHKIGYLMYNSFTFDYNEQLNDAFLNLKNENVTDLILDLRYNGGGSVRTSLYLSSMITGQFSGEVFTREQWNPKVQEYLEENHPEWLVNYFTNTMEDGTVLNTLHLDRVIVLTTKDSASASELVINALKPYIDVVTIGTTTHGKYVASMTLYDSETFTKEGVNKEHNWAIQPIIIKEINKLGDYAVNGFDPTVFKKEDCGNMGVLGTETEPMTATAIDYITGRKTVFQDQNIFDNSRNQLKDEFKFNLEMYIDKKFPFKRR
jgi:hypothetical protein